jgi:hypothetical protein
METRLTNAVPYAPQAPARVEAAPVRQAVRTDLSPPQAVAAQVGAEQTRWQKDHKKGPEPIRRQESMVTTDRETGDLVYQIIDPASRTVISQTPHETILKLRAYLKTAENAREEAQAAATPPAA